jgi:peptide subunit release factor 1 (eRF1)
MVSPKLNDIKKELNFLSEEQMKALIHRLSKYKKENKELLSYLIFEADNEHAYVQRVKQEIDENFDKLSEINLYIVKKGLRKILRNVTKYIKFSDIKQTETELLIYFAHKMKDAGYTKTKNVMLNNLFFQHCLKIEKSISGLHEDLQYDYRKEFDSLSS